MKKLIVCLLGIALLGAITVLRPLPKQTQTAPEAPKDPIVEKIHAMTPSQKAGQLMLVGLEGTEPSEAFAKELKQNQYGGVILFDSNLQSAEQTKRLTGRLQSLSTQSRLLIGVDEEGGQVARMKGFVEPPPSEAAIGRTGDPKQAEQWAQKTAGKLKELGFTLNLAPVADLGSANGRSYSKNAATVSKFVEGALTGYRKAHLLATLKHFPGLGKGQADTHVDEVVVDADRDTLLREDVKPFQDAMGQFPTEAFAIMVTHVRYPALDPDHPASLSRAIMTDLLRNQLQYKGIVMTDDLGMGAISKHVTMEQAGVQAIAAGADLVMICHNPEWIRQVHEGLTKAIEDGTLPAERVEGALYRVLKAKEGL